MKKDGDKTNWIYPEGGYDPGQIYTIFPSTEKVVVVPRSFGSVSRDETYTTVNISPQYIVSAKDVICVPRQVLIQGGKILPDSFRRQNSKHAHVQLSQASAGQHSLALNPEPTEIIEDPCFYFDGEHADHFGHFTLEVLSRLWPFQFLDFSQFVFITSAKPHARHMELLKPFGIKEGQIRYFKTPVLCRNLLVASQGYILEKSVSDAALAVWNMIGDYYGGDEGNERMYVSRARWIKQRNMINEEEVELIADSAGLKIISPEMMSVVDQVRAFRGARDIVGPSGSGMYNCVYSRKRGKRLILASASFLTLNDALVNKSTNSAVNYLTGKVKESETKSGMLADWEISLPLASDSIRAF